MVQHNLQKDTKNTYAIQISEMSKVSVSKGCITNFPTTGWLKTISISHFHNSTGQQSGSGDLGQA